MNEGNQVRTLSEGRRVIEGDLWLFVACFVAFPTSGNKKQDEPKMLLFRSSNRELAALALIALRFLLSPSIEGDLWLFVACFVAFPTSGNKKQDEPKMFLFRSSNRALAALALYALSYFITPTPSFSSSSLNDVLSLRR